MEPTSGTAVAVYGAVANPGAGFIAHCPAWIGHAVKAFCDVTARIPSPQQLVNATNTTLAENLPALAGDAVREINVLGFKTTVGTFAAYSISVLAVAWPILYEAAGFISSVYEDLSTNRKVSKMIARLNNLQVKNQKETLEEADMLLKEIGKRVVHHHNEVKSQRLLSPETFYSVAVPMAGMILTGAGVGLGAGALAAAGVAGATLATRTAGHFAYKFRHSGMGYLQNGYLKQLDAALTKARQDIEKQV